MSISAGLFFATKETAIITAAVLIIAIICAAAWDTTRKLVREGQFTPAAFIRELKRDFISVRPSLDEALAAIIIFVFINLLFYNSFFYPQPNPDGSKHIYWQGVMDAVESVALWSRRSGSEHVKSFWYYFGILFKLELPLLAGSLLAGVFVIWRGARFWLFVAAWALGLTLAYSLIGYKTPWLMISFLIPMAIISGHAAEQIYRALPEMALKLLWAVVLTTVLILSGVLAWKVNFRKPDDNSNSSGYFTRAGEKLQLKPYTDGLHGYVYAQTDRDFFNLVQAIKDEAGKLPARNHTGIYVASPDYWPLPWSLRDYDKVAYTGNLPAEPQKISQPIIIAGAGQRSELDGLPGWRALPQSFTLRPSVTLVIYVRDENPQQ
jgi:predicted membrane-bound mannosyltransferase